MSGTTAELGLATPADADDLEIYLATNLVAALITIDGLFSTAAGHDHSGAHLGKPIPAVALAQPLALTSPVLTSPTINVPIISGLATFNSGAAITGSVTMANGLTVSAGMTTLQGGLTVGAAGPFSAGGAIRLGNASPISWRNTANGDDIPLYFNSSDELRMGNSLAVPGTANGVAGYLRVNVNGTSYKIALLAP